jgi:hypothetical protein
MAGPLQRNDEVTDGILYLIDLPKAPGCPAFVADAQGELPLALNPSLRNLGRSLFSKRIIKSFHIGLYQDTWKLLLKVNGNWPERDQEFATELATIVANFTGQAVETGDETYLVVYNSLLSFFRFL